MSPTSYASSVKLAQPDLADVQILRQAQAALARGDYLAAEQSFARVLSAQPRSLDALRGLGYARFQLNQLSGALEALEAALAIAPNDLLSHQVFGRLCLRLKEPADAIKHFKRILKKMPTSESARSGLADAHVALGEMDEAQKLVRQMLAINERSQIAWLTATRIHEWTGRHDEERNCFEKLAALAPGDMSIAYQRALTLLRLGEFAEGWAAYENRVACGVTLQPATSAPRWQGEAVGHLLVVAEQGFGDVLQFMRFLPQLTPLAGKITFACQASLKSLVARSMKVDVVDLDPATWPGHDEHILLMSLPFVLNLGSRTVAPSAPYLVADPARVTSWRARFPAAARRRIAVVHASASPHPTEENAYTRRTCPLEAMAVLNNLADTEFLDLKVGRQQPALPGWLDIGAEVRDFDDSAALLQSMDALVTVDTSAVHLAGAQGRPTFLLLPYCSNWRWMTDARSTPWYKSVRMYRQSVPGDWSEPLANVMRDLAHGDLPGAPA